MSVKSKYFSRNHNVVTSIGWGALRSLGESRVVQSSMYWIFFVPIAARFLGAVNSPLKVRFLGQVHNINLTLPFSWYALYFPALCFAVGAILYRLFCPPIISEFANFNEFQESGAEGFRLETEIEKAVPNGVIHDSPIWRAFELVEPLCEGGTSYKSSIEWRLASGVRRLPVEKMPSLFYTVREVVNHSHPWATRSTLIFFALGFILLGIVLLQNLNFVLVQLLGGKPLLHWPF